MSLPKQRNDLLEFYLGKSFTKTVPGTKMCTDCVNMTAH